MLDHEHVINRNPVAREAYKKHGTHFWLYNKTRTRRWCNISDRQEQLIDGVWEFIDQPKREGFI